MKAMFNEDETANLVIIVDGVLHATSGYRGENLWAWNTRVACDASMAFDSVREWTDEQIDQHENRCNKCYAVENRKRNEKRVQEQDDKEKQ